MLNLVIVSADARTLLCELWRIRIWPQADTCPHLLASDRNHKLSVYQQLICLTWHVIKV